MPRDTNPRHLHPQVRERVAEVLEQLRGEGLPFKLFEGFRSPSRQADLYAQGRTKPGAIVTRAQPWRSYHQYGLAVDLVLFDDATGWSWSTASPRDRWWTRIAPIGRSVGLEALSWEKPHLQLAGLSIDELRIGKYPEGGDWEWAEHLEEMIHGWHDVPAAPAPPSEAPRRPLVEAWAETHIKQTIKTS